MGNSQIDNFTATSSRSNQGALAESLVCTTITYKQKIGEELSFWRTKGGSEMDFILNKNGEPYPIDVKWKNITSPQIGQGFTNFVQTYQPKPALVLTKGFWGQKKIVNTQVGFIPAWYI